MSRCAIAVDFGSESAPAVVIEMSDGTQLATANNANSYGIGSAKRWIWSGERN